MYAALAFLREVDTLVVWPLDRLGRSMTDLLESVGKLEAENIGFRSLTENIDTTTPTGRLVFHISGALDQFERDLTRERTSAGLRAAAARGRKGGRPKVVTPSHSAVSAGRSSPSISTETSVVVRMEPSSRDLADTNEKCPVIRAPTGTGATNRTRSNP